jgi:hypothetical protein
VAAGACVCWISTLQFDDLLYIGLVRGCGLKSLRTGCLWGNWSYWLFAAFAVLSANIRCHGFQGREYWYLKH